MKHLKRLTAIALMLFAGSVWAYCYTHTYIGPNGQFMTCQTCCSGSNCTTTCF